ncbi:hypothetical protein CR513_20379, partial [Mucuna pruriens]
MLVIFNSSEPFIVYSDAFDMSLRDVLMLKNLVFSDHKSLRNSLKNKMSKKFKDYNFDFSYYLGKANVVVNALSMKSLFKRLKLSMWVTLKSIKLGMLKITSDLMEESREGQRLDLYLLDQ